MTDLNQLERDLLGQVEAPATKRPRNRARLRARQEGLRLRTPEDPRRHDAGGAQGARPAHQRPARQGAGRDRQEGDPRRGRARRPACRRAHRRDAARPGGSRDPRAHPPDQPGDRADGDLRRYGLLGGRRAGHRDGLSQLHGAQLPGRPSGPRDARHLLPRPRREGRAQGAAHPYLAGADPHDDGAAAADPGDHPGPDLSARF